jgi:hypothetical protein
MNDREFLFAPEVHDPLRKGGGLMQEFDIFPEVTPPPGFSQAEVGGDFLKIGVGTLIKYSDKYRFNKSYEVQNRAETSVQWGKSTAVFVQVSEQVLGYAYRLDSRIEVIGNEIRVVQKLTNTGTHPLKTENYVHNYFRFDNYDVEPEGYEVTIPYVCRIEIPRPALALKGDTLVCVQPISPRWKAAPAHIVPDLSARQDDRLIVSHSDAEMRVTCEVTPSSHRATAHIDPTSVSIEQFVLLDVLAGESVEWTRLYRFECSEKVSELSFKE